MKIHAYRFNRPDTGTRYITCDPVGIFKNLSEDGLRYPPSLRPYLGSYYPRLLLNKERVHVTRGILTITAVKRNHVEVCLETYDKSHSSFCTIVEKHYHTINRKMFAKSLLTIIRRLDIKGGNHVKKTIKN